MGSKSEKNIYDWLHEHFGRGGMHASMNVNGGHVNKWSTAEVLTFSFGFLFVGGRCRTGQ